MNLTNPSISGQATAPAAHAHAVGAHRLGSTTDNTVSHGLDALWDAVEGANNEFSAAMRRKASGPDMDRLHEACWVVEDAYEAAFEADCKAA